MPSNYSVACPHQSCGWTGSLVPSHLPGGADAEIASVQRAWFQCPRCKRDWQVWLNRNEVLDLAAVAR